jgi:hypothetical protein
MGAVSSFGAIFGFAIHDITPFVSKAVNTRHSLVSKAVNTRYRTEISAGGKSMDRGYQGGGHTYLSFRFDQALACFELGGPPS